MRHVLPACAALALFAAPALAASTPTMIMAPLWLAPGQPRSAPAIVASPAPPGVIIIREQPPLLTPADLRFSVEDENGVTVVRGPRAR